VRALITPVPAPSKWLTLVAACFGLGMLMVNTFVVNVALPAMARDFDVELSTAQWIVSGFVLALGVLPIAAGRLGDILGRREVYLAGLVVFIASSLACAMARDVYVLIAFRVLQGAGAAIMQPATLSIVTHSFPVEERGMAIGIWSGVSGLGLIFGPVLGGLLVHGDYWRLVFLVNVPLGAFALIMAYRFVPKSRDDSAPRVIDWLGVVLLSTALLLVMFAVTRGNSDGWRSPLILGCFATGSLVFPLFVVVERASRYPLVDLSLFRGTTFVMACVSAFLFSAAVFGSQPYTSLFMQNYWGLTPLEAGLAFLPSTVLVAMLMPISGIMGQRLGHRLRLIVMAGSVSVAVSFLYLLRLAPDTRYVEGFLPAFVLRGIGIGLVMSATSLAVVSAVPLAKSGLASGTLTMARNVGTAMGVAVLGSFYLRYVDTETATRFPNTPAEQVSVVARGVERFVPATASAFRAASEQLIVDGFVLVSAVCVAMGLVATGAAFFIRHGGVAKQGRPASASAAAVSAPALSSDADG